MPFSAHVVAYLGAQSEMQTAAFLANPAPVLLELFIRGAETANIHWTTPISKVLTLALGAGQISEPSVVFPRRPPWSKLQRYVNPARA